MTTYKIFEIMTKSKFRWYSCCRLVYSSTWSMYGGRRVDDIVDAMLSDPKCPFWGQFQGYGESPSTRASNSVCHENTSKKYLILGARPHDKKQSFTQGRKSRNRCCSGQQWGRLHQKISQHDLSTQPGTTGKNPGPGKKSMVAVSGR